MEVDLKSIERIDVLIQKVEQYKGTQHEFYFQRQLDAAMGINVEESYESHGENTSE